ncbi:kinesin-like protein KIN-14C [Papaver somniferum]|uniref:kinesin-like protein KIN-14C n=1 Tax=Papaver somniferum TaxID=3469 RepID=UPI000E6FE795|nr:kinesin-like protein KIN-14C [Papaver somniferum]
MVVCCSLNGTHRICTSSQPNGLTVADASMHPVESVSDVVKFMQIGLAKQARGLTALNERSIRSHRYFITRRVLISVKCLCSILTVHERLREAQYISKSSSALGDVIFSLSQKNDHVPYADSQLTQVLQSSLGGQAKTVMFVQLNPDVDAYSETLSTLNFVERFSGVEVGSAEN